MQIFLLLFDIKRTVERSRGPERGRSASVTATALQLSRVAGSPRVQADGWA